MKTIAFLCLVAPALIPGLAWAAAEPPLPLAAAVESQRVTVEASGNGRERVLLALRNSTPAAVAVTVPAGLIATGRTTGERVVVLRCAETSVPGKGAVDITLPAAALSLKCTTTTQPFQLTNETEPRLAPLLKYLASQPDAPRATAQLAVLCLLENITFAQWLHFLTTTPDDPAKVETHPTPAEVAQAIDVLGILHEISPDETFALKADGELKLRALRNPWCRAKAMQIYGLQIGDGALPPDIGQLLHTQPGDNCPVCRQRTRMQQPVGDP